MLADVIHRQDVGMVQRGGRARFLFEPMQAIRVSTEGGRHDFDGHVAREARVVSFVDLAHAAGPEGGENFIRAESGAGCKGRWMRII